MTQRHTEKELHQVFSAKVKVAYHQQYVKEYIFKVVVIMRVAGDHEYFPDYSGALNNLVR